MKRVLKLIAYPIILLTLVAFIYINIYGNFHKVNNDLYRSNQLNSFNLSYYVDQYEIRSIINLRGEKRKDQSYLDEIAIAKDNNITHIDFKMRSKNVYDEETLDRLVQMMQDAPKPLLVHCLGGADRTSLAVALYEYSISGKSSEEAMKNMKWYYGHLPSIRPHVIAMDKSFENYVKAKEDKKKE